MAVAFRNMSNVFSRKYVAAYYVTAIHFQTLRQKNYNKMKIQNASNMFYNMKYI